MRILLTFGCLAACLTIGGRLAWNALELGDCLGDSNAWSISSLIPRSDDAPPAPESTTVRVEDSLVPPLMLPKVEVLDMLNKPTRGTFGSILIPGKSVNNDDGIVVPRAARPGSKKSPAQSSSSRDKSKIAAYESAPNKAFGLNRNNPLTTALNARSYTRPRFNFTSESRKQNSARITRKYTR